MPEDISTLAIRKILMAIARSYIGSHYLHGTNGELPDNGGKLIMLPKLTEPVTVTGRPDITEWSTIFTAQNGKEDGKKKRCPGRYGHNDVESMPKGDHNNPAHVENPDGYRWQRLVRFNNLNPLYGESCIGKAHFDCIGFIRYCLRQVIPKFYAFLIDSKSNSIAGLKGKLEPVSETGVRTDDLCVGDILIKITKDAHHIAFATGGGPRIIHAEWEPSGVVESDVGTKWTFHGRIARERWLDYAVLEPEE
jgi:hypothetical protein